MDPTPFMTEKPKRKTVRAMKQELTDINDVVAVHQLQRVQQQVQQVQQQVQHQVQQQVQQQAFAVQEMQGVAAEDTTTTDQEHLAAVASVINQQVQQPAAALHPAQAQQLPRNVTIVHGLQNPNDGQNTIYLSIPGNLGEKDQIVAAAQQNVMNFPQLVMAPTGAAIQTHGAHQMAAAAPAQGGLHVLAAAPQQNPNQPHATPVQTVLMATHPAAPIQQPVPVEVSAAAAVPVSMQQVINAQTQQPFQGFAGFTNYDQYQPQL